MEIDGHLPSDVLYLHRFIKIYRIDFNSLSKWILVISIFIIILYFIKIRITLSTQMLDNNVFK
jgi:hypothetical protein